MDKDSMEERVNFESVSERSEVPSGSLTCKTRKRGLQLTNQGLQYLSFLGRRIYPVICSSVRLAASELANMITLLNP
jgi:hypothetical protein